MPATMRESSGGWICPEHPDYAPDGLRPSHATNSMAKHNRDHHSTDVYDAEHARLVELLEQHKGADAQAKAILLDGFALAPF